MLTVSLHGIKIHAKVGLYPEEKITGNHFEIDVDVFLDVNSTEAFPFIDYTIIRQVVAEHFGKEGDLLESFVKDIHTTLKQRFSDVAKIKVAIRKLRPPMEGDVNYAQVCFEG
jgi:7,8-dihydroneopterin aldolase/epimerase/oxygenase